MKTYLYRRVDNGEIVEVDFETMMTQEAGFITLSDGVEARRCVYLELERSPPPPALRRGPIARPIISDNLGFGEHQLADFKRDREEHGFSGVEFIRDPTCREFFQVKCDSRGTWNRYVKHRGMVDKNKTCGVLLSEEDLRHAQNLVERVHG